MFSFNMIFLIFLTYLKVSLPFASSNPEFLDGLIIPSPVTTLKYTNEANMAKLETKTLVTFGIDDKNAKNDYEKVLKATCGRDFLYHVSNFSNNIIFIRLYNIFHSF